MIGCRFGVGVSWSALSVNGSISLSIIGLFCLSPALADLLHPVVLPVYAFSAPTPPCSPVPSSRPTPADSHAAELAADPQLALFSGWLSSPVMGTVISFGIPVTFGLILPQTSVTLRSASSPLSSQPVRLFFRRAADYDSGLCPFAQPRFRLLAAVLIAAGLY